MIFTLTVIIATTVIFGASHGQNQIENIEENGYCINSDGVQGICKRLDSCPTARNGIKAGILPKICSFAGTHPIVCCPPNRLLMTTVPSTTWTSPSEAPTRPSTESNFVSSQPSTQPNFLSSQPSTHSNFVSSKPTTSRTSTQSTEQLSYSKAAIIARKKCDEYAKSVVVTMKAPVLTNSNTPDVTVDHCGTPQEPLIVGGENARPKEFPHMAQIGYTEKNPEWLCGGSLISERFILSAAHCSHPTRKGPALWARVGDLDTSTEDDEADPQILKIIERIDHPDYNPVTFYNDLALFKLETNVEITPYVRPICLRTVEEIPQNSTLATGWGHTSWEVKDLYVPKNESEEEKQEQLEYESKLVTLLDVRDRDHLFGRERGIASATLMKVKLNLVSNENCNRAYKSSVGKSIPRGILKDSMLCAGDEAGKDTCQGDSGGPLQITIKKPYCMYDLIGATSFGRTCGNAYPGVYTRISHFIPWIVQNVWPEETN